MIFEITKMLSLVLYPTSTTLSWSPTIPLEKLSATVPYVTTDPNDHLHKPIPYHQFLQRPLKITNFNNYYLNLLVHNILPSSFTLI